MALSLIFRVLHDDNKKKIVSRNSIFFLSRNKHFFLLSLFYEIYQFRITKMET